LPVNATLLFITEDVHTMYSTCACPVVNDFSYHYNIIASRAGLTIRQTRNITKCLGPAYETLNPGLVASPGSSRQTKIYNY